LDEWKEGETFVELMDDGFAVEDLERVFELHAAMLRRARRAIDCLSMAGRRRGVVKDMRVMIAKMLWAEAWRWGNSDNGEQARKGEESARDHRGTG
jgi:hypothetical protein